MRYLMLMAILVTLTAFTPSSSVHASEFSIIAVVQDDAITNRAVSQRAALMLSSGGMANNTANRQRVAPQALQMLINESLQRQHGEEIGITVQPSDLSAAIAELEERNGLKPGGFNSFVKRQGINREALLKQIEAQILWKKIVGRRIMPRINVTDEEVSESVVQLKDQKTTREVFLREIVLDVEGSNKDELALARDLMKRIYAGQSFDSIAREFSTSASASEGGKIGWILANQLREPLRSAVQNAETDELLKPLETETSIRIIQVGKKRTESKRINENILRNLLLKEKMDLESRKYMKQLRQNALIDIRG